jgi:hypothetical protein
LFILGIVLACGYSLIEIFETISLERFSYVPLPSSSKTLYGLILFALHIIYSVSIIVACIVGLMRAGSKHFYSVVSYSVFICFGAVVTIIVKVFLERMEITREKCFSSVAYINTHILIATAFLFFQKKTTQKYTPLGVNYEIGK